MLINRHLPPVIILGGDENALSVARSLGQEGIRVFAIGDRNSWVRYSRFCNFIAVPPQGNAGESWIRYLTGLDSAHLRGAVLLACSDTAIEFIAKHREVLLDRFVLDESNKEAQLCMLDKLQTYRNAVVAGVPTPRFWHDQTPDQIMRLRDALVFPLLVKPLYSHLFQKQFGRKFFVVQNVNELMEVVNRVQETSAQTMLVEMIPGPDDRLCSYYTYLDAAGNPLFDFTKRVIRRFPTHSGGGCYHITDKVPKIRELSLKLFRQVKLMGLANVEFKLDERDGQLKLIECNARFTAANCLLTDSGYDLALFVYNRLVGRPQQQWGDYPVGKRLWYPLSDLKECFKLRQREQITLLQWLRSVLHIQSLPYFRWYDPLPSMVRWFHEMWQWIVLKNFPKSVVALKGGNAAVSRNAGTRQN